MTSILKRGSIIVAGMLATTLFHSAACVAAQPLGPDREAVDFNFKFRHADLDTQRGAQEVHRTLVYKATVACTDSGVSAIGLNRTDRACVAKLVEQVVQQIGSQTLFAAWKQAQKDVAEQMMASSGN